MVQIKPISFDKLRGYVNVAFDGDKDLVTKYHVSPGTVEHCVSHTLKTISKSQKELDLIFFGVYLNDTKIGFLVTGWHSGVNILYSFGINIKYRKRNIIGEWWSKVCGLLSDEFICGLWSKNTRAIKFLKNNGMVVSDKGTSKTTTMITKNLLNPKNVETCQLQLQR